MSNRDASLPLAGGDSGTTNTLFVAGDIDAAKGTTDLRLADGRVVRLTTSLLLDGIAQPSTESAVPPPGPIVVPVIEEQLEIHKRRVETGRVVLQKNRHEIPKAIDEALAVRTYEIERVQCNVPLDVAPSVRQEGDTTIYPVFEERLIVTKQLFLTEEVRVTRLDTERRDTRTIQVVREDITAERRSPLEVSTSGPMISGDQIAD